MLRLPANVRGPVPAVILIHGSDGIDSNADAWARQFNEAGAAALILDSFSGRGIEDTIQDQGQLDSLAMMVDAYRALDVLATNPHIRADRIAVMGFSKGAVAAVFSADKRFKKAYSSGNNAFAAHIGMYTPCNTRLMHDSEVSSAAIRLFHGTGDDYVDIGSCRELVSDLRKAGAEVTLTEYEGAQHAFDTPTFPKLYFLPKARTTRACRLREGANGVIFNLATSAPYSSESDACVTTGAHIGYSAEATAAAQASVLAFIRQVLLPEPP